MRNVRGGDEEGGSLRLLLLNVHHCGGVWGLEFATRSIFTMKFFVHYIIVILSSEFEQRVMPEVAKVRPL